MKKYLPIIIITLVFFIIPFFWLKPGEMDLGGDNTRLYYYDPASYIKYLSIYNISQVGKGSVVPSYFYIPYVSLLAFLKYYVSSTTLINLINGLTLSIGFASICLIVYELILPVKNKDNERFAIMASVLAGLFYIASFGSINMTFFWDRALITHNQIFINPLMFYLLMKFMLTQKCKYLWISIIISFILSPNFSPISAPPIFAFYPLAIIYLFIYTKFVRKQNTVHIGTFISGFFLFLGVQAFHLLGEGFNVFDKSSAYNTRIFNTHEILSGGLDYFTAISGSGKVALGILLPSGNKILQLTSFIVPLIITIGLFLNKYLRKKYLLTAIFFLITLFFVTANITNVGFEFYRKLFYIPGFSMFRIFFEKWAFVNIFFYAILFGFANYLIINKFKPFLVNLYFTIVFIFVLIPAVPLLLGEPINKVIIWGSNNVRTVIRMDPKYEQTLQFIRRMPADGKFIVFPLTDFFRQLVYGKDGGVYEGPSTISFLTDKYSYAGYQDFGYQSYDPAPYAEDIMKYSRQMDYMRLLRIFNTLNIRYIFHNSDPRIYEEKYYPGGDYFYMRTSLPKTQSDYEEFVGKFPVKEIYKNGSYNIYELDESEYNPTIFIPQGIYFSDRLLFDADKAHSIFISESVCRIKDFNELCLNYKQTQAEIKTIMLNQSLYKVTMSNYSPGNSIFLVLQHTFNSGWKLKLNNKIIGDQAHVPVNGYANGWFISGKDLPDKDNFTLDITMDSQKYFWYGSAITVFSMFVLTILLVKSFIKNNGTN